MFNYKIEHKPRSTVDSFRIGKQKLLDEVKNKPIIEASIKKQLKDNMFNSMKEYFSLDDLLSIEEIKKHFNIFVITGDRNIGKSTAGKVYCENLVAQGHKFVWLRNQQTQIDKFFDNAVNDWFVNNEWRYLKKAGQIFTPLDINKKATKDNIHMVVGYGLSLGTSHNTKSVDYKGVNTIIYDEFNDSTNIKDKYRLFTSLIGTVERKTPDFKVVMFANYIDQGDDILFSLGGNQKKTTRQPLVTFNWISRSIIWNIPKNHYKKTSDRMSIAERLAHNDFTVYTQEYGGTFNNEYATNIKNLETLTKTKPLFYLWIGLSKLIVGKCNKDEYFICDSDWFEKDTSHLKEYVISAENKLKHINSKWLPPATYRSLQLNWKKEKLFATSITIASDFIYHMSNNYSPIWEI